MAVPPAEALSAAALLDAWDRAPARSGDSRQWDARNAALLAAFGTDTRDLTAGGRQAALLRMYAAQFGDRLDGVAACPTCGVRVDVSVPVAELVAGTPPAEAVAPIAVDGRLVHWRLPDGDDLAAAAGCPDPSSGALLLLTRCVTDASLADLPNDARTELARRVATADPFLDISLDMTCPDCGAHWDSPLDIGAFVASALHVTALRLLAEVSELAIAYGWTEPEVLALSPARRSAYLAMVRGD
jgi:hypothetical protein